MKRWLKYAALLLLIASPILFWTQRQSLYDWYRLKTYQPSSEIEQIAQADTMTDEGKHLFYVAHAQLSSQDTFNQYCSKGEYSIVLGCYITRGNIYVYNVTDERLRGIHEVTAAHEMLHVAYERLSDKEREHVNSLIQQAYASLDDDRIKATVAQYQAADPGSVPNELHSILGSEVRNLPPELEHYYSRYFTNRLVVVGFSEQYESEFTSRQQQVNNYDKQLASLKITIEANQQELALQKTALETQRDQLNQLKASRQYDQYNAQVDSYNAAVNSYNSLVSETKQQITQYNSIVSARNALVVEVQQLVQAIDSTPQSIQ